MRIDSYLLYINTLKYMKFKQIRYRFFYMVRSKYRKLIKFSYPLTKSSKSVDLILQESINSYNSYEDGLFVFLNVPKKFAVIDWNFMEHGKLWAYNLNYFEYLHQKNFNPEDGLKLIENFIDTISSNKQGLEPFPISLRGINWIKFLSKHKIKNQKIDDSLYAQYYILLDNLEYHILGNHLLENGFSLLYGAYYFYDKHLYKIAKKILIDELNEEILADGGHYELSPMYHQLMLFRLLDCINLVKNNKVFDDDNFEQILSLKAGMMISWLENITYKNGDIPMFNDSAKNIAPSSVELFNYAKHLEIKNVPLELKESGYRVYDKGLYELRVDVGEIGPSYIPGHAHSDTFNFELRVDGDPFIVDTGISTYDSNKLRVLQRSTESHNTVKIGDIEQSEVWSAFRVGNRANIVSLVEDKNTIVAKHDGYLNIGLIHQREYVSYEDSITIIDTIKGSNDKAYPYKFYIHFHPDVVSKIELFDDKVVIGRIILSFKGLINLNLDDYGYAEEFNKIESSKVLVVTFDKELLTKVVFI